MLGDFGDFDPHGSLRFVFNSKSVFYFLGHRKARDPNLKLLRPKFGTQFKEVIRGCTSETRVRFMGMGFGM